MSFLLRVAASYIVLVGAAVAVHFIITPLYHSGGGAPFTAWRVMNWFSSLSPNNVVDPRFWVVLGAAMPILMVVAGLRLWKHAASAEGREEPSVSVGNSAQAA